MTNKKQKKSRRVESFILAMALLIFPFGAVKAADVDIAEEKVGTEAVVQQYAIHGNH